MPGDRVRRGSRSALRRTGCPRSEETNCMSQIIRFFLLACVCLFSANINAQTRADPDLLNEISKIKAIDNHAHPLRYVAPRETPHHAYTSLPFDPTMPFTLPPL